MTGPRWARFVQRLCFALPWLALAWGALAWLRFGVDMPWFDDWRAFSDGTLGRLDPVVWFRPVNDTLAPVGFALDTLAQRALGGHSVLYQFLSMLTVLGSLLCLQWTLLRRLLGDAGRAALCFVWTLPMLQPGSYWGLENMAYHQALPLVFLFAALNWMVAHPQPRRWHGPAVLALGLWAGGTYISGAFGVLSAALALAAGGVWARRRGLATPWIRHVGWLGAAGGVWVVVQCAAAVWGARAAPQAALGIPLAWPHEAFFWWFYAGKLARALMLPAQGGALAFLATLLALAGGVAVFGRLLQRAAAPTGTPPERAVGAMVWTLAVVVGVYLGLVAAGRTHFRPPEIDRPLEVFAYGFLRFHFFWATLLWPWLVAALCLVVGRSGPVPAGRVRAEAWAGLLSAGVLIAAGALGHWAAFRGTAAQRAPVEACLREGLQTGGPIRCPGLLPPRHADPAPDARPAYWHARDIQASWVQAFPLLAGAARPQGLVPVWAWTGQPGPGVALHQLEPLDGGRLQATGPDPQVVFTLPASPDWARCRLWDIELALASESAQPTVSQVFFRAPDQAGFSEDAVRTQPWTPVPGGVQTLYFRWESPKGLAPVLRLDPVDRPQALRIDHLRGYCRLADPR
ncbi:MAG: hypothetical protein PHI55_15490 [Burkholderiaceae bacterium]|nr:hypothetical protein [Burkholderiaceae bacterium]